ncbi:MAG: 50S ribosomal protein L6 [Deinococcus sp.]|nr:50S ribosomal protein L6 [Deinococcus sp.]
MSRVGKAPIPLPTGVTAKAGPGELWAKGPRGELKIHFDPEITIMQEGNQLLVRRPSNSRRHRSLHGLVRALAANVVKGVTQGYSRVLELKGTGYRAALEGKDLLLQVGYSHPVRIAPPEGIVFKVPEQTIIEVSGVDKQLVGQVAADVRKTRPPDHYHGKGVRYRGEQVRIKPGKAGTTKA